MEPLRASEDLHVAAVGDASSGVTASTELYEELEWNGSRRAEHIVGDLVEDVPGDAVTVAIETKGQRRIQNGDELRRLAEEGVVIADAFEAATARIQSSRKWAPSLGPCFSSESRDPVYRRRSPPLSDWFRVHTRRILYSNQIITLN